MEAVGNLHGVRDGPRRRFRILAATIPTDHLHTWVLRKPPGEGVRTPVRQDVYQCVTFEVHKYRPVAGPAAESEVVHAQDLRRLETRKPHRTNVLQQGVPRDPDPEVFQQTIPRFAPECE